MNPTAIPYLDLTWSPVIGCTHSGMSGCDNCWARELHNKRHKACLMGKKMPAQYAQPFETVQLFEDRLLEPLQRKKPARIGVCFQADLFHPSVPWSFINKVWGIMLAASQHTFIVPTKRIDRAEQFFAEKHHPWDAQTGPDVPAPNIWLGFSASTQPDLDWGLNRLLLTQAAVRFLSLEPILGPMDLAHVKCRGSGFINALTGRYDRTDSALEGLSWIAAGCESGPRRRHIDADAFRSLRDQCISAGVRFYLKQMEIGGKVVHLPELDGRQWLEFAEVQL